MREWLEHSRSRGMSLGLERGEQALKELNRPDKKMACIHVAGSNGKGSACAQLVGGLARAGYSVGLFTSPHISRIEERVRIQGRPISADDFDQALSKVKDLDIELTFFEITFLVAMIACSDAGMQIMILETGLGGRLDATRAADVVGCLVTSVTLEHSEILGETLEEIAREKAAIWRTGIPMLIRDPESPTVRNAMREEAISARFTNPNAATIMDEAGDLAERLCAMLGLEFVRRPIHWPARMQYIEGNPALLLDAAHNPSGMARVMPEIANILPKRWSLLLGCTPQKDMEEFLLPLFDVMMRNPPIEIITTEPQGGRYPGVEQPIADVQPIAKPEIAIESFTQNCELVLVIGSLYLCGNILSHLELELKMRIFL